MKQISEPYQDVHLSPQLKGILGRRQDKTEMDHMNGQSCCFPSPEIDHSSKSLNAYENEEYNKVERE